MHYNENVSGRRGKHTTYNRREPKSHRLGAVAGARPLAARSTSSRALWSSPLTTGAPLGRRRRLQGRLHVPHRVDWGVPIRAAVVALALDAPKPFRVGLQGSQVQSPR